MVNHKGKTSISIIYGGISKMHMAETKENYTIFDEVEYKEAADLARTIEIGWTEFELFGINYELMTSPSKNDDGSKNGEAAEYRACKDSKWDIYLWEDLKEYIQIPLLFHEIVEVYLRVHAKMDNPQAHNATVPLEERFCKEFLSKEQIKEFLKFKKELGCDGFSVVEEKQEAKQK